MSRLLIFDPSGNKGNKEGDGTTGYAVFEDEELVWFDVIKSENFDSQEKYWKCHTDIIKIQAPDAVLIESYKLFAHKAQQQSWSTMDTPQLIGYLRMFCWEHHIPIQWQDPSDKQRVNDDILVKHGIFEKRGSRYYCQGKPTVIHARDAIRHGIFFYKFGKGKELVKNESKIHKD